MSSELLARVAALEGLVVMMGEQTFGDTPGHDFHGNQWTAALAAADKDIAARNAANPQSAPAHGFGWHHNVTPIDDYEHTGKLTPVSESHSFDFSTKNGRSKLDGSVYVGADGKIESGLFKGDQYVTQTHSSFTEAADHVERHLLGAPGDYRATSGRTAKEQ